MKGKIIAAYTEGEVLHLWFMSPIGDVGEPYHLKMDCLDAGQAQDMANYYHDICDMPKHEVNA
jgi:hypothetical protein